MSMSSAELCPNSASFFGYMGVLSALSLCVIGSAYGTAKSGIGIAAAGILNPAGTMRLLLPAVMAGVLGIYGLIVGSILAGKTGYNTYSAFEGYAHLSSGLCVGLAAVAAGLAIGVVGDAGVRAISQQPKLFASIMLILVFAEALGLYGLIVSLTISSASPAGNVCAP